jgi:DNA repair exonuclease SbcCD ATPase subunit
MRILSVTVKNVRMHEDLTVSFDRERTVVIGPNESGKSTLVDAIERVLCYPYRSTADNLDGLKPRAGGGPPEVSLEFERHGQRYAIHKIFKGPQAVARLIEPNGTVKTGADAEVRLRELLGFDHTQSRGPFGGWSHLWARQGEAGEDPTNKDALGDAAKELDARLKSMSGTNLAESRQDTATGDRIAKEHHANYTANGNVKAGSRLSVAAADLATARDAAAQAAARLAELEAAADAVDHENALINEGKATLADAENRLGEIGKTLAEIEALEETLAGEQAAAAAAAETHSTLQEGDAAIEAVEFEISTRSAAVAPREQEIAELIKHEHHLESVVAACLTAIDTANESRSRVAAEEELVRAVARVFTLEAARADLEATLKQIAALEEAIAAIDESLAKLPAIDQAAVENLESLDRQLEVTQGKLAASATRVEVLRASVAVTVDGKPLTTGEPRLVTDPAEISIGDETTLRVSPGSGESMLELREAVSRIRQALATELDRLGLKTVAEARPTLEQRIAAEAARERDEERIAELDGDGARERLAAVTAERTSLEAEIGRRMPAGFERPTDPAAVIEALHVLEAQRRQADEELQAVRARYDSARSEFASTRQNRKDRESDLEKERRALLDLHIQKTALEAVHGTDRKARLTALAADQTAKENAARATEQKVKDLAPDTVRMEQERYENTVKVTTDAINAAAVRRASAETILASAGTTDPHGDKAAAEARHETARRQHAEIEQRAHAVRFLRDLFEKRRQEMADLVAAPLREKVREYLDSLFGPGNQVSITKANEQFKDLTVARPAAGGLEFGFNVLSGGTREQVAATWRLAMAEVLAAGDGGGGGDASPADPCLPMVFDDAFVNSDPERIEAVQRVLYLASRRGLQIIVLSCNPKEYTNFAAKRVDLPSPKHAAAGVPATVAAAAPAGDAGGDDDGDDPDNSPASAASPGQRPEGDDDTLAATFLSAVAATPDGKAGNSSLRGQLGWDEATYERIRDLLIASGRLKKRRGRGGSVSLPDGDDPPA